MDEFPPETAGDLPCPARVVRQLRLGPGGPARLRQIFCTWLASEDGYLDGLRVGPVIDVATY